MPNLSSKLIDYLKYQYNLKPNKCQINASKVIEDVIKKRNLNSLLLNFISKKYFGIYIHGPVGTGKSVLIKALHFVLPRSDFFHFSDFIFHLQFQTTKKNQKQFLKASKVILIDEFFINNLTNLIIFKKFLESLKNQIIVITSNKKPGNIYFDPVNKDVCEKLKKIMLKNFYEVKMVSNIDYRSRKKVNDKFFFFKDTESKKKQNLLRKKIASSSKVLTVNLKRRGYNFDIEGVYGNTLDINFEKLFKKNLVFQDFELISKKWKFIIIRDMPQINKNSEDLISRFISFIDVLYENKNILSLSTKVKLDKLYIGEKKVFEFKRTISRLKEIASNTYIEKYK